MTEQEAWDTLNRYKELCKLYTTACRELAILAKYSMIERIKACSLLEPHISDVLERVDAALRRLKGLKHFKTLNHCWLCVHVHLSSLYIYLETCHFEVWLEAVASD